MTPGKPGCAKTAPTPGKMNSRREEITAQLMMGYIQQ